MATHTEHKLNARTILEKLAIYESSDELLNELEVTLQQQQGFISIGFLNQHGFNLMLHDPAIFNHFQSLGLLLRDGIGISLALKYSKMAEGANLNGTDLIPQIAERFNGTDTDCYVLGTESPWLEQGSATLLGSNIKAMKDGFQPADAYIKFLQQQIQPQRSSLIILAMGMPKQEEIAVRIQREVMGRGLVICGGAIIDFQAGRFKRAPDWMQRCSLEWLYRLFNEPKRLFKRYVIGIPVFMYRVIFSGMGRS